MDTPYKEFAENETARYLSMIEGEERRGAPPTGADPVAPDDGSENEPRDPEPVVAMDTE